MKKRKKRKKKDDWDYGLTKTDRIIVTGVAIIFLILCIGAVALACFLGWYKGYF